MSDTSNAKPLADAEVALAPEAAGLKDHGRFPVERAIAAIALFLIVAISAANVVVRYATNASFAFTEEYSVVLLVVLAFAGSAAAFRDDDHIRILVFARLFGPSFRRAMLVLSTAATLVMFALVIWYALQLAIEQHRYGDVTAGLGNPAWLYTVAIPLLSVPILIRAAISAIGKWRRSEP